MAKHDQAVSKIQKGDPGGNGVPGHYSGREDAKVPGTGTGEKKNEQNEA